MFTSLILFLILIFRVEYSLSKNTCKISNLDEKMSTLTMMLGDDNAKWPESEQQKHKFCRQMYEAVHHGKFYKRKCYSGIARSIMKFTIHAIEYTNIKLTCKSHEEIKRFIRRGKCGNKAKKETTQCWTNWVDKLNLIKNSQSKNKVAKFCCSLFTWKKCSLDVYQRLDRKVCSKKSVDEFDTYMERSIVDPLNIIFHCGDHESKECHSNEKHSPITRHKVKYKTPFPAILAIYESL